jgi:hypothetical protein
MENRKFKLAGALAALLLAACAATAAYATVLRGDISALQKIVSQQKAAIDDGVKKLAEQTAHLEQAKRQAASAALAATSHDSEFKSSIEAFAKQAASCERVKHQLSLAESTVEH